MDPLTVAAAVVALGGIGSLWHQRVRADRIQERSAGQRVAAPTGGRDPLTGLPDRAGFREQGPAWLADPRRAPGLAVLLDLPLLAQVHRCHGRSVADHVLVTVGWRFARYAAQGHAGGGLVARWDADRFAGLLPGAPDDHVLDRTRQRLAAALSAPIWSAEGRLAVSASIGVVPVRPGDDLDEAVRRAGAAAAGTGHRDRRYADSGAGR